MKLIIAFTILLTLVVSVVACNFIAVKLAKQEVEKMGLCMQNKLDIELCTKIVN